MKSKILFQNISENFVVSSPIGRIDRRENTRSVVSKDRFDIPIEINDLDKVSSRLIDISSTGISCESSKPYSISERLEVRIKLPDSTEIKCHGRVIWKYNEDQNFSYGIHLYYFQDNDSRDHFTNFINNIQQVSKSIEDRRREERRKDLDENSEFSNKRKYDRRVTKSILLKCIKKSRADFLEKQSVFFRSLTTVANPRIIYNNKEYVSFTFCNYLGLNNHPKVKKAMIDSINEFGTTTASSRLSGGTMDMHLELEKRLADFIGGESCITYVMGYLANLGTISAIADKNDYIFIDNKSHASLIDACILSGARVIPYRHNNMQDLDHHLKKYGKNKFIITDGVFSMDGDLAKLDEIYLLGKKHDAAIMVDDAHGIGIVGKNGCGTAEYFGLRGKIDIIMGTLSKAIPCLGGSIVATRKIIEYLKWTSRAFIFNLSLPHYFVKGSIASLDVMASEPERRERLMNNVNYIKSGLANMGFDTGNPNSGIVPIFIRNEKIAFKLSEMLENNGIFIDPVGYPVVKRNESLLRVILSSEHKKEDLDQLLNALKISGKELQILK